MMPIRNVPARLTTAAVPLVSQHLSLVATDGKHGLQARGTAPFVDSQQLVASGERARQEGHG